MVVARARRTAWAKGSCAGWDANSPESMISSLSRFRSPRDTSRSCIRSSPWKTMSRSLWFALCLLGAITGADADQDVAAGDAALTKFDLGAALKAYRAAHTQSPDSYEATWKLARALADTSTLSKDPTEQKQ